jgi:hypothetical protein
MDQQFQKLWYEVVQSSQWKFGINFLLHPVAINTITHSKYLVSIKGWRPQLMLCFVYRTKALMQNKVNLHHIDKIMPDSRNASRVIKRRFIIWRLYLLWNKKRIILLTQSGKPKINPKFQTRHFQKIVLKQFFFCYCNKRSFSMPFQLNVTGAEIAWSVWKQAKLCMAFPGKDKN